MTTRTYVGIADCHGLESFVPIEKTLDNPWQTPTTPSTKTTPIGYFLMRARFNRQRHALVYKAEVETEVADMIYTLLEQHNYKEALIYLKRFAITIEVERGAQKSFKMIPNPDLDATF
jgi:hypothetical protein